MMRLYWIRAVERENMKICKELHSVIHLAITNILTIQLPKTSQIHLRLRCKQLDSSLSHCAPKSISTWLPSFSITFITDLMDR